MDLKWTQSIQAIQSVLSLRFQITTFIQVENANANANKKWEKFLNARRSQSMSSSRFWNFFICQTAATASVISFFSESSQIDN